MVTIRKRKRIEGESKAGGSRTGSGRQEINLAEGESFKQPGGEIITNTTDPKRELGLVNKARTSRGLPEVTAEQLQVAGRSEETIKAVGERKEEQTQEFIGGVATEAGQLTPEGLTAEMIDEQGNIILPEVEGKFERAVEAVATAGLTPAVTGGNLISSAIGAITGEEFKPTKASELAETPAGKALGVTTVGAAVAGLGVAFLGKAAALAANVLGKGTGGFGAGFAGGVASDIAGEGVSGMIDRILGRESSTELQGAVNTIGQMAPTYTGMVEGGGISPEKAIAQLRALQTELTIVEGRLKQAEALDPRVRTSGQYVDIMTDVRDQRGVIEEQMIKVLNTNPQYNPDQIASIFEELQQIELEHRARIQKNR